MAKLIIVFQYSLVMVSWMRCESQSSFDSVLSDASIQSSSVEVREQWPIPQECGGGWRKHDGGGCFYQFESMRRISFGHLTPLEGRPFRNKYLLGNGTFLLVKNGLLYRKRHDEGRIMCNLSARAASVRSMYT